MPIKMSFNIVSTLEVPQEICPNLLVEGVDENADVHPEFPTKAGIFSNLKHTWLVKGSYLEVRDLVSGRKIGSWRFGGVSRDQNTIITSVEELKRDRGNLPFLIVALYCPVTGGLICVFDCFVSKVLRAVQIDHHVSKIHVVDPGCTACLLPESCPLKYLDGIVAIGTLGGDVFLMDLCKQACESGLEDLDKSVRDEVNPCMMSILKKEKLENIKKYIERSVDKDEHLVIHLNVTENPSTEHFTLKGQDGDDRVHVDRSELEVSAIFYSQPLGCLLVGYNFGAFQMWDFRNLNLCYTSPICEDNIPITNFMVQEPADDPKAYCYVWVSYSHDLLFQRGLPFAIMYSFYFNNKTFVDTYGHLYEDFQHCSIRFQLELGDTQPPSKSLAKGGTFLGFQSINKCPLSKDSSCLSLCLISWLFWGSNKEVSTAVLLFDLNQWYKEQMPRVPNWAHCSNYIIKNSLKGRLLDIKMDLKSLVQFMGIQRLEEHFCPTSFSFDLRGVLKDAIIKVHNKGSQKAFLDKIMDSQHLALLKPEHLSDEVLKLGLVPLFCDIRGNTSPDLEYEREILLSVILEQKMTGWLCQVSAKLANDTYKGSNLGICHVMNWSLKRAVTINNALHKYCAPLFDYSGMRLDDNTLTLVTCGVNQIRNICTLYRFISSKLFNFVPDQDAFLAEQKSFENLVVYFETLLWMANIGLLPERQTFSAVDNLLSAPYLVEELKQYYNKKRVDLQLSTDGTFAEKDCLLFIDNLINNMEGVDLLRQQWQEDGGNGLYPPPSLQSVLRVYLVEGPELRLKHSLVAYVLLDIALSVDEHNKVVKLLLKFPQIFELSQSDIKIVQAFWYLDHDRFENAVESILDPSILLEDLHHWHHSVMLNSLLMQDHTNLALLYLQIRKPSIQTEKDLFTVISLLISRNMLDEAFKFRQLHKGPREYDLLTHIFNECNKNQSLHSLLYRRLSSNEERAFFNYLQGTKSPRCEDLQMFYYLLRARFLEAFDIHSMTRRTPVDTKGLHGQQDASTADSVMKIFRHLLPDVSKSLVAMVRKERTNLWKEHPRPAPFSVFVHNAENQVQYKSSVIFAALSKAKETFNDTIEKVNVSTEDMPFLRTPTVYKKNTVLDTPVLRTKVIEQIAEEEFGPSPRKKLKLSPRASVKIGSTSRKNLLLSNTDSKLSTPIVKRKRPSLEKFSASTTAQPQSILKSRSVLDDSIFNTNTSINTSIQAEYENSIRMSRFDLMPRKSLRTPLKSRVKFDDIRYSGSSLDNSSRSETTTISDIANKLPNRDSTESTENEFYSPQHSFTDSRSGNKSNDLKLDLNEESPKLDATNVESNVIYVFEDSPGVPVIDKPDGGSEVVDEQREVSKNVSTFDSPRSRKSYKRSLAESATPLRSSPRLSRKSSDTSITAAASSSSSTPNSPIRSRSSIKAQNIGGRKSLSRTVLEQNAFSLIDSTINTIKENVEISEEKRSSFSVLEVSESSFSDFELHTTVSDSTLSFRKGIIFDDDDKDEEVRGTEDTFEVPISNVDNLDKVVSSAEKSQIITVDIQNQEDPFVEKCVPIPGNVKNDDVNCEMEIPIISSTTDCSQVYEDLSSASEDVNQVLEQLKDITENSSINIVYEENVQDYAMIIDDSDVNYGEEDEVGDKNLTVETDKGTPILDVATQQEVIEINSSSDESNLESVVRFSKRTPSTSSESSTSSSSTDGSASSNENFESFKETENSDNKSSNSNMINDSRQIRDNTGNDKHALSVLQVRAEVVSEKIVPQCDISDAAAEASVHYACIEDQLSSVEPKPVQETDVPLVIEQPIKNEGKENVLTEKRSISVQFPSADTISNISLNANDIIESASLAVSDRGADDKTDVNVEERATDPATGTTEIQSPAEPLLLRTVKKTYGRKDLIDVESTPKLAVERTTRTYSRKPLNSKSDDTVSDIASNVVTAENVINISRVTDDICNAGITFVKPDGSSGVTIVSMEQNPPSQISSFNTSNEEMSIENQSPIGNVKLRTVIKTYGRKHSSVTDVGASSMASTELTQDTYSRCTLKPSKLFDANATKLAQELEGFASQTIDEDTSALQAKVHSAKGSSAQFECSKHCGEDLKDPANVNLTAASNDTMMSQVALGCEELSKSSIIPSLSQTENEEFNINNRMARKRRSHSCQDGVVAGNSKEVAVSNTPDPTELRVTELLKTNIDQLDDKPSQSVIDNSRVARRRSKSMSSTRSDRKENAVEAKKVERRFTRKLLSDETLNDVFLNSPNINETIANQSQGRFTRKLLSDETLNDAFLNSSNINETTANQSQGRSMLTQRTSKTTKKKIAASDIELLSESVSLTPRKRGRSYSVDQASTITRGRQNRSNSIDVDDTPSVRVQELSVNLPPINEHSSLKQGTKRRTKASSQIGDYTTARRLTRRQATMLEAINSDRKLPIVAEINPLHLMDKQDFKGSPDLEELKVLEASPSTSSETLMRQTRSASVLSDTGNPETPTKRGRKTPVKTPSVSGIKSRLRKASTDTMSVTSEKSGGTPSPPKKTKSVRSRSRASSVSSTKSNSSDKPTTSTRSTRAKRLPSTKTDLPELEEEIEDDTEATVDPPTPSRKGGRK